VKGSERDKAAPVAQDRPSLRVGANILTYYAHRVTNAVSEGINSAIQTIKKRAFGYRNPDNFKTAIFFHCGGLDLYPAIGSPAIPGGTEIMTLG